MNPLARIAIFGLMLTALGAGTGVIGNAVGPLSDPANQGHHGSQHAPEVAAAHATVHEGAHDAELGTPAGLQTNEDGYTLELDRTRYEAGLVHLSFRVLDREGVAVRDFESVHGKRMHLIVVDHDLVTFRHVHPELSADGTWSARLRLPGAGDYRVFTDFKAAGSRSGITLGHDIAVAGVYRPASLPAASDVATIGDYDVTLEGDLAAGRSATIRVGVEKGGLPVRDLEPYLEAYGHLVALRVGDLAYLHVHPEGAPGDGTTTPGPTVAFDVEVPSTGTYRLFLDFKHAGRVRTAAFTASAVETRATGDDPALGADGVPDDQPSNEHSH